MSFASKVVREQRDRAAGNRLRRRYPDVLCTHRSVKPFCERIGFYPYAPGAHGPGNVDHMLPQMPPVSLADRPWLDEEVRKLGLGTLPLQRSEAGHLLVLFKDEESTSCDSLR